MSAEAFVIRVDDLINETIAGHPGCHYTSPPHTREQALQLVDALIGTPCNPGDNDPQTAWSTPTAGGRRTITLTPLDRGDGSRDQQ